MKSTRAKIQLSGGIGLERAVSVSTLACGHVSPIRDIKQSESDLFCGKPVRFFGNPLQLNGDEDVDGDGGRAAFPLFVPQRNSLSTWGKKNCFPSPGRASKVEKLVYGSLFS